MTKLRLYFVTAVSVASLTTLFSLAQQKSDATSKVLVLEAKWNEAYKRGDIAAMNSLLADDSSSPLRTAVHTARLDTLRIRVVARQL